MTEQEKYIEDGCAQIEFDCRIACESYPRPGEDGLAVLARGDFQSLQPRLLRWRYYLLDEDGERCDSGEWHEMADNAVRVGGLY